MDEDGDRLAEWTLQDPAVMWRLLNSPSRQSALRGWLIENRPDAVPDASARRRRRGLA